MEDACQVRVVCREIFRKIGLSQKRLSDLTGICGFRFAPALTCQVPEFPEISGPDEPMEAYPEKGSMLFPFKQKSPTGKCQSGIFTVGTNS